MRSIMRQEVRVQQRCGRALCVRWRDRIDLLVLQWNSTSVSVIVGAKVVTLLRVLLFVGVLRITLLDHDGEGDSPMKRGAGTLALLFVGITGFLAVWWLYELDIPASSGRDEQAILRHIFGNGDLDVTLNTQRTPEATLGAYVDEDVFEEPVSEENHILFLEITCLMSHTERRSLTAHQVCSVEAAAAVNLESKVFLLYTCDEHVNSTLLRKIVLNYPNIRLWQISMKQLSLKTPLEDWRYNKLESLGAVPQLLSVFKYGGTYLDLGVVLARSLEQLGSNFVSYQDEEQIIALNLQSRHSVLQRSLISIKNGGIPSSAFQQLLSEILKDFCNITQVTHNIAGSCSGINILPASVFLPIPFNLGQSNETAINVTMETPQDSFGVHVWDTEGVEDHLPNAELYCPEVYKHPDPETIVL